MIKTFSGIYGDVVWRGDDLVILRMAGSHVVCESNGAVEWSRDVSAHNHIMFLTGLVAPDGDVYATGKTNSPGAAAIVGRDRLTVLPSGQGNFPSQLAIEDGRVVCHVVHDFDTYRTYDVAGNLLRTTPLPAHRRQTSNGIRFVRDNGAIVWGDDTIGAGAAHVNGRQITEWMARGAWIAGQGAFGGVDVFGPGAAFTAMPGPAFFPRLAVNGPKVAVLKQNGANVHVEVYAPPYPTELAGPVTPPPPPDDPKEPVVSIPKDRLLAIRDEVWADERYTPTLMANTDETKARSVRYLARIVQLAHARGLPELGLLFKHDRDGFVADVLTWTPATPPVLHYDVISGGDGMSKTGHDFIPKKAWTDHGPITDSDWEAVRPGDPRFPTIDEGEDPPKDPPNDPPADDERIADLENKLSVLRVEVDKLRGDYRTLEGRVQEIERLLDEEPGDTPPPGTDFMEDIAAIRRILEKVAARFGL